jgi:hypothetical protein
MTMVVPAPIRGKYEIARPHRHALALDSRVGAFALDNEAQRIGRMPVGGRDLAGLDHLHAAKSEFVMYPEPGSPGFSSMNTRRSASFAVMSSIARIRCGRMSR